MGLITINLQGLRCGTPESHDFKEIIMPISGTELINYDPEQNEAVILCKGPEKTDDLILKILEAGFQFTRYFVAEQP